MEERRESNLGGCNVQICFGAVSGNACCEGYKLNRSVINPIKKTAPKGGFFNLHLLSDCYRCMRFVDL